MPKPIELMIEVEEIAMGKVWRTLDTMKGVVRISLKGSGPKKGTKTNGKATNGGPSVGTLVIKALQNKKTLSKGALEELLEANGKKKTSLPSKLTELKAKKQIAATGDGLYKITAAGRKVDTSTTSQQE